MSHHLRLQIQLSRAMEASSLLVEGGYVQLQAAEACVALSCMDTVRHESKALARLASVAKRYDAVDCAAVLPL